jgi:hypothetical protein
VVTASELLYGVHRATQPTEGQVRVRHLPHAWNASMRRRVVQVLCSDSLSSEVIGAARCHAANDGAEHHQ